MTDPRPKTAYRPTEVTAKRGIDFDLAPDTEARAALAGELGILSIPSLRFTGTLKPAGRADFRLDGRLAARVEQACIVTLDPVLSDIDEPVTRRFLHDMPVPSELEAEMPEDDTAEPLGAVIDLAEVMREALALALPPYPRSPRADTAADNTTEAPDDAEVAPEGGAGTVKPFADLARLLGQTPEKK